MKALQHEKIRRQLDGLLASPLSWESALVSIIALLKHDLDSVSWAGFYRDLDGHLWVGPYQGKLACIHLKPGQGVCGLAFTTRQPQVVPDVEAFEGHVACDPLSRSEVV